MTRLTKRDLNMLKMTCQMDLGLVAERLDLKTSALYARFAWLRRKRGENQKFINTLNSMERTCPKLRKLLTSGLIKNEVEKA